MKSKALIILFFQIFTLIVLAAEPKEVCDVLQSQDNMDSTQKAATDCNNLIYGNSFNSVAVDVCLTIAKMDNFKSTQDNVIKCMKIILKKFNHDPVDCLENVKSDPYGISQTDALDCLRKYNGYTSLPGVEKAPLENTSTLIPQHPFVREEGEHIVNKPKESKVSFASGFCPAGEDCWRKAILDLRSNYHCEVELKGTKALENAVNPEDNGQSYFVLESKDCKIRSNTNERNDSCPGGTKSATVTKEVKICVSFNEYRNQ